VVNEQELASEARRSAAQLRGAVSNRGVTIAAVSTRPPNSSNQQGGNGARRGSMFGTNVLDETAAQLVCSKVLLSRDKTKMPDLRFAPDALRLLSYGIQQHMANIVDLSSANSRKRSNRTACEHFTKTQKLMSLESEGSAVGEVAPENRRNLGMLWGPDVAAAAKTDMIEHAKLFFENYATEEESLKVELQQLDDERKPVGRRRQKETKESAPAAAAKEWWVKEVRRCCSLCIWVHAHVYGQCIAHSLLFAAMHMYSVLLV
jgi:hypothetical protein